MVGKCSSRTLDGSGSQGGMVATQGQRTKELRGEGSSRSGAGRRKVELRSRQVTLTEVHRPDRAEAKREARQQSPQPFGPGVAGIFGVYGDLGAGVRAEPGDGVGEDDELGIVRASEWEGDGEGRHGEGDTSGAHWGMSSLSLSGGIRVREMDARRQGRAAEPA